MGVGSGGGAPPALREFLRAGGDDWIACKVCVSLLLSCSMFPELAACASLTGFFGFWSSVDAWAGVCADDFAGDCDFAVFLPVAVARLSSGLFARLIGGGPFVDFVVLRCAIRNSAYPQVSPSCRSVTRR